MSIERRLKELRKDIFTQQHALRNTKNEDLKKSIQKTLDGLRAEVAKLRQDEHPEGRT